MIPVDYATIQEITHSLDWHYAPGLMCDLGIVNFFDGSMIIRRKFRLWVEIEIKPVFGVSFILFYNYQL